MTKSAAPIDIGELVSETPARGRKSQETTQRLQKRQTLIVAAIAGRVIAGAGVRAAEAEVIATSAREFTLTEDYCRELWRINGEAALRDAAAAAIAQNPSDRSRILKRLEEVLAHSRKKRAEQRQT